MNHNRLRGLDLHSPSQELVVNESGSQINKLKIVKIDSLGTTKPYPAITLATPLQRVAGITNIDLPNNECSLITSWGFMNKVNTSLWPISTLLYCDASSNLSTAVAGLPIAKVLRQDAVHGVLYIRTLGYSAGDLVAAANNTIIPVLISDWLTDDSNDTWSITLNHNLGSLYPDVAAYLDTSPDEEIGLFRVRSIDINNTKISVCQAGVDGRFNGFIVLDK